MSHVEWQSWPPEQISDGSNDKPIKQHTFPSEDELPLLTTTTHGSISLFLELGIDGHRCHGTIVLEFESLCAVETVHRYTAIVGAARHKLAAFIDGEIVDGFRVCTILLLWVRITLKVQNVQVT